jgi:tetratricopeptide (TPR) repeat protein
MNEWLDAESHADRASELYERGRWAEAEAHLRKALALHPDHGEWHYNLGLTLEASGRDAEALAAYERSIELMSGEIEPVLAAGAVCNRLGHYERAIGWLQAARRIDPRNEAAFAHEIESHVKLGQHEEAETIFYLAQHSLAQPSAHCLMMVAESLWQREELDRAAWCLREALRLESNLPRARARLASVLAALGQSQKALQMYLRELRDDPGSIDTLLDFGDLLVKLGRLPEAGEKYRRVLELEPANVDAHFGLGRIALESRRFAQAQLEFDLVFKLDSEFPEIRLALAEALLGLEQVNDAQHALLDEHSRMAAAEAEAEAPSTNLARLGMLMVEAQLPSKAVPVLERVLESSPDDPAVLRKLALAKFQSGNKAGGSAISRRVLRLDPGCVQSIHNLALAALDEGRLRSAAGWIRRGLKADRNDEGIRRLRARLIYASIHWAVCSFLPWPRRRPSKGC